MKKHPLQFPGFAGKMIAISNIPQTIHLDTIRLEPRTLAEVVISANRILPDRQLFFPSKVAVKRSTTGFDLLQNMTIPGVHVDMEKQKVEKRGFGKIPIYINEKPASAMDVVASNISLNSSIFFSTTLAGIS